MPAPAGHDRLAHSGLDERRFPFLRLVSRSDGTLLPPRDLSKLPVKVAMTGNARFRAQI